MTISDSIKQYTDYLEAGNYADATIVKALIILGRFSKWLTENGKHDTFSITENDIKKYCRRIESLTYKKGGNEKKYAKPTINAITGHIKNYLLFLYWCEHTTKELHTKVPGNYRYTSLPKNILSRKEAEKLVSSFGRGFYEQRDKAIVQTLYNTGIRISELVNLLTDDVNLGSELLHITQKKTRNDRYAPMTEYLKRELTRYLYEVRPYLYNSSACSRLFVSHKGKHLSNSTIAMSIKRHAKKAGIEKNVYPHLFRHTFAVHLLKNGCSVRYIKDLLGHESITSTQVYTEITNEDLRKELLKSHPLKNDMMWKKIAD